MEGHRNWLVLALPQRTAGLPFPAREYCKIVKQVCLCLSPSQSETSVPYPTIVRKTRLVTMQRYAHKHDASVSLFPFDPCLPFLAHLSQPLPIAQAPKEWFLANLLTRPEFQFMACTVTSPSSPVQTCCKGP